MYVEFCGELVEVFVDVIVEFFGGCDFVVVWVEVVCGFWCSDEVCFVFGGLLN